MIKLFPIIISLAISISAYSQVYLTFDGGGDDTIASGVITLDFDEQTATISNQSGTGTLGNPSLSGDFAGLTGNVSIQFEAKGSITSPFNEDDFTGASADGVFTTSTEWAVNSDLNNLSNTSPGQGIVFTFDLSGLEPSNELTLIGTRWQNTNDGSRLNYRANGDGPSTAVYSGGGTTGDNASVVLNQPLNSTDEIAFWATGSGQRRLKEFTFEIEIITPPEAYQHLDASVSESVTTLAGAGTQVTAWLDQSPNENDAIPGNGVVTYPGNSLLQTDLPGVDLGNTLNTLQLFTSGESDSWLDFGNGGAAENKSGFSVLIALKYDAITGEHHDILGNNSTAGSNGFFIRRRSFGDYLINFGGISFDTIEGGQADETVVLALNYNASTGRTDFLDTTGKETFSVTIPAADFTTAAPFNLGGTTNANRFLQGIVGEVKIYDQWLEPAIFQNQIDALTEKWITVTEIKTPRNLSLTSVGDERVELDWDDDSSGDLFASFNVYRSTIIGGPYTLIADELTKSDFQDINMTGGITYYYVVTAVSTENEESHQSNEVTATPDEIIYLQNLDATADGSVITEGTEVVAWNNLSSNLYNAGTEFGSITYPGTDTFASGITGLEFGSGLNTLELFSATESDSWLNQISGNGFSLIVTFIVDEVVGDRFNFVLGNSENAINGFRLGYNSTGQLQGTIDDVTVTSSGRALTAGDTVTLALVYDGTSLLMWDSINLTAYSQPLPPGDFSNANPVSLGGISGSPDLHFNGSIGSVQVFGNALDDFQFREFREDAIYKWAAPPNIIVFFVDDLAWYGTPIPMDDRMQNSFMSLLDMPNLESLVSQSMLFRNAYSGGPMCVPSRASLQTGMTTARHGFTVELSATSEFRTGGTQDGFNRDEFPVIANGIKKPLDPSITTIPEALDPFGYKCAHYGKWHLTSDPSEEGYIESDGPTNNAPGTTFSGDIHSLEGIEDPKRIFEINSKAMNFMEAQVDNGNPFYIQLSHYAAHEPRECFPESRARFQNLDGIVDFNRGSNPATIRHRQDPAVWLGMMYDLDQSLGQLLQKVEDLGIKNNTYIIYVSDNGYRHDWMTTSTQGAFNQPFHARKWWCWQGGIRVPMFVRGPGIPEGSVNTVNVVHYDFLPTFLDWAGGDPNTLENIDGVSLKAIMEGEPPTNILQDRSLYWHYPHYRTTLPHSAILNGKDKVMFFYDTPVRYATEGYDPIMLFNLSNDVGEFNNLQSTNTTLGNSLWADMAAHMDSVDAWVPKGFDPANPFDYSNLENENYVEPTYDSFINSGERERRGPLVFAQNGDFNNRALVDNDEPGTPGLIDYWFNSWNTEIGEDTDDFDNDGVSNLLEYYLGKNPIKADRKTNDPSILHASGNTEFVFYNRYDAEAMQYSVEQSTNLVDWAHSGLTIDIVITGEDYNLIKTSPVTEEDKSFFRLSVNR